MAGGERRSHGAFDRRGVRSLHVVSACQQARRHAHPGPQQAWDAGEGGAPLHDRLHRRQPAPAQCIGLGQHLLLQDAALTGAGADHERQQACRPTELAAIEHELRRGGGTGMQRQHGQRQPRPAARIHGRNRFMGERCRALQPGVRIDAGAADQAVGFPRRTGQQHGVEGRAVDLPGTALGRDVLDPLAQLHARAAIGQPLTGGMREQPTEIHPWQQQVGAAPAAVPLAEQRIAHHAQEHLAAGARGWRVQRGHAQRFDQLLQYARGQAAAKLRDVHLGLALEPGQLPAQCRRQHRRLVAHRPAAGTADAPGGVQRRRPVGQGQSSSVREAQRERQPQERGRRIDAHVLHQLQGRGVGADHDVLAVVEHQLPCVSHRHGQAAGAPAEDARTLEQRDAVARARRGDRGRQPGPAGADDGDLHRAEIEIITSGRAPGPSRPARTCAAASG